MAKRSNGLFTRCEHPMPFTANSGCLVYGDRGPGVDLGVEPNTNGNIFLGMQAIQELAEVAGFSVNAEGEELEREVAHLQREVERLTAERADLSDQLDAVSVVFARAQTQAKPKTR